MAPSLAATLIARNESRCITRCLESIRPWVDRILVLDTGSSDDTVALAKRCGAEVHHMDWRDDFSAARNHALDLADADWNLVLDADEWITSGGDALRAYCEGPPRLGVICVHSAFDALQGAAAEGALPSDRSWITRLLPRGARYEGRVHEQVVAPLPRERLELHVAHDGYLEAQRAVKRDRNRPLLLLDLQDRPEDPYILFQLGKEAEVRDEYSVASEFYAKAFQRAPDNAGWLHELVVRYLHCLAQSGESGEALALAEQHMQSWEDSPDFFFVLGNILLDRAMSDPAQALDHWLPLAVSAWERCLEIGERPELQGSIHGRGSHLAQHNLDVVRAQLPAG